VPNLSISPVASCPGCGSRVPGPCYRRGRGHLLLRCRVCDELLTIARLPEVREELENYHSLGREIRIDGYELLGLLGQGGMGMVFSGVRESDHSLVAIKMLPPDCLRYPELIARFEQEARLMAALSHPSIIGIHDMGRWKDHPYLVMDYVPGVSLREHIDRRAPLALAETLTIAAGVAEAIQACHDANLVHRDLKPGNVLLSQSGRIIVTDFGIANLIQRLGEQTDFGVAIGTPQYIAPEQLADGSKVDFRADQYSVAILIHEMLTRRVPQGAFKPIGKTCPELTPAAEGVILRALAYKASDRYDSVRHFMRALRKALPHSLDGPGPDSRIRAAVAASCSKAVEESTRGLPIEGFDIRRASEALEEPRSDSSDLLAKVSGDFQLPVVKTESSDVHSIRDDLLEIPSASSLPPTEAEHTVREPARANVEALPESRLAAPGGSRWIALAILGIVVVIGVLALAVRAMVAAGAQ